LAITKDRRQNSRTSVLASGRGLPLGSASPTAIQLPDDRILATARHRRSQQFFTFQC